MQPVVPRRAPLARQLAKTDESELPQAQSLTAQQASRSVALLQAQEPAPWALQEPLLVLLEHLALPLAQPEPQARSASPPPAPH